MPLETRLRNELRREGERLPVDSTEGLRDVLGKVHRRRRNRVLLSVAATLIVVAGGIVAPRFVDLSVGQPEPPARRPDPVYSESLAPLVGTYAFRIPRDAPGAQRYSASGAWRFTIQMNGEVSADDFPTGYQEAWGIPFGINLERSGDVVTTNTGFMHCDSSGRYRWKATAEGLSFTTVRDPCPSRRIVFTSTVWAVRR